MELSIFCGQSKERTFLFASSPRVIRFLSIARTEKKERGEEGRDGGLTEGGTEVTSNKASVNEFE